MIFSVPLANLKTNYQLAKCKSRVFQKHLKYNLIGKYKCKYKYFNMLQT